MRGNVEDGVRELRDLRRPLQRARRELLGRDRRRVRPPPGPDRRRRRLEPRHDARHGDGRPAAAARGRRRHQALRRRAPPRGALPPAAAALPTCCCSTSRPTTSTPSRVAWLEQHLADYKGAVVAVTHDRYFLDNVAGWILELDRGRGIPFQGNYSSWLEQKTERLAQEQRTDRRAPGRSPPSSSGCARTRRAGARSPRPASPATSALLAEDRNVEARRRPDPHPGRARASATG